MRETTKHRKAFAAYLDLGARRTIERLRIVLASEGTSVTVRPRPRRSSNHRTAQDCSRFGGNQRHRQDPLRMVPEASLAATDR